MDHLSDVSIRALQRALDDVDGGKPTQRLVAAIAYKNGVPQTELADWFGVERKTIYNWLRRLETEELAEAAHDDDRPGRPRKLSGQQWTELQEVLNAPPTAVGIEAGAWTTDLVRQWISTEFGVDYSRPSCRRVMREVGLRHRTRVQYDVDQAADATGQATHIWLPE